MAGRPDFVIDLTAPGSLESLKNNPFTIKESARFRMKAQFVVQHDVLSGLKYIQSVKRKGIRVAKNEEMIVSIRWRHEPSGGRPVQRWVNDLPLGVVCTEYRGQVHLREEMYVALSAQGKQESQDELLLICPFG